MVIIGDKEKTLLEVHKEIGRFCYVVCTFMSAYFGL